MNEMNDIYQALQDGLRANSALSTWVRGADANDLVRSRERVIQQGLRAYDVLSSQLREGRKHIEPPDDYKRTQCGCQDPGASPPCSWCTDPANFEPEDEPQ